MKALRALLVTLAAVACMAAASEPNERLPDPAQEARARAMFREVRCLVCQNESIDDSQADLAADLRRIVRQEIAKGRSDREIRAFLVARYGEFVLLKPPFSAGNAVLWLAPAGILAAGGGLLIALLRRRRTGEAGELDEDPGLSAEEEARLADLLEDKGHDCAEKTPQEAPPR
ncbi:cytochrome c-type biogenesis protein [Caulobacter sp.]|uniref:cytochrome c-type biogenesis protein n=1 Tax=Caulobacter sp. TaxID=78 RepID=UPI003BA85FBC